MIILKWTYKKWAVVKRSGLNWLKRGSDGRLL
jgi:hypothetical protein